MNTWPEQSIREVADGIFAVIHGQGQVGVSNATFVVEQGRALVVDTMTFPEMTAGMVRAIAQQGAQVSMVLNTHHHIDHVGGNKVFADARILAHPGSISTVQQLGLPAPLYDRLMPQFRGRFADLELVIPEPLQADVPLLHGGELYVFTPAHTPADVTVWFPESRVLLAGDVSFIGVTPLAANGLISAWIEALDTLIGLKPEVVVPGHGPVGTLADLLVLRDYFATIQRLGCEAARENVPVQEALASFDAGPVAEWIEVERNAINLERVMQEARGEISRTNLPVMSLIASKR
ncbi:MAG: MBL fold metallo-hydrolase [Ktedonobacteraceae bacterium]|jgi:cyclase